MIKKNFISSISALLLSASFTSIALADNVTSAPSQLESDIKVSDAVEKIKSEPLGIAFLRSQGVTLTFLGNDGGNDSYLGVAPDGKMQAFYLSNDKMHLIPGLMYGFENGHVVNITAHQIVEMQNRIKLEKSKLAEKQNIVQQNQKNIQEEASNLANKETLVNDANKQLNKDLLSGGTANKFDDIKKNENISDVKTDTKNVINSSRWLQSNVNADDFAKKIDSVYWFSVGKKDANLPVLYMVVDPTCPHCHNAWSKIKDLVFNGKLNIHIVMISGLPGSLNPAIQLLSKPNPGLAWLQGEGSSSAPVTNTSTPSSKEYHDASKYIKVNTMFASDLKIQKTPWLAYIKDNKVYEIQGESDLMDFVNSLVK